MTDITSKLLAAFGLDNDQFGAAEYRTGHTVSEASQYIKGGPLILRKGPQEDKIFVGYLADDYDSPDFWDDGDFGKFHKLGRSPVAAEKAEQAAEQAGKEGKLVLSIERYEHSLVHYSVLNTGNYVDRRFDVGAAGFFVPHDDHQALYRQAVKHAETLPAKERAAALKPTIDKIVEDVNKIFDDYSNWCNGAVFAAIVEEWRFDRTRNCLIREEAASVWNCLGTDNAEAVLLKETCLATAPELDPVSPPEPAI